MGLLCYERCIGFVYLSCMTYVFGILIPVLSETIRLCGVICSGRCLNTVLLSWMSMFVLCALTLLVLLLSLYMALTLGHSNYHL